MGAFFTQGGLAIDASHEELPLLADDTCLLRLCQTKTSFPSDLLCLFTSLRSEASAVPVHRSGVALIAQEGIKVQ